VAWNKAIYLQKRTLFNTDTRYGHNHGGHTKCTDFFNLGSVNRAINKVSLKLHQKRVDGDTAISVQRLKRYTKISWHRLEHVRNLMGNSIKCRAGKMGGACSMCHAKNSTSRCIVPMGRAKPCKRRNNHHTTRIRNAAGQIRKGIGIGKTKKTGHKGGGLRRDGDVALPVLR
jgi:hypothetical protein